MTIISTSDAELVTHDETVPKNSTIDIRSVKSATNKDNYIRPGTFIKMSDWDRYASTVLSESFKSAGLGPTTATVSNFLSRLDRHGTALIPANTLNYGYTFITRPRLNMSEGNLRQHPILSTLLSQDPASVGFMIRMLLDTRMHRGKNIVYAAAGGGKQNISIKNFVDKELELLSTMANNSPLLDRNNPFFTPLCNGLKGISGWPDFNLVEETTEGDFHSGDFTFIKGSDMNNKTQELSLEFKDVQGSVLLAIFYYWCLYMALQAKGVVMAYGDDIYLQRLNYTVSIYRFVTDPSRKHIVWWAKATGCFPKSVPVGALFNVNQGEVTISSASNFSVPFVANDIKYNDPGILLDFNYLMKKYCPGIEEKYNSLTRKWEDSSEYVQLPTNAVTDTISSAYNFMGLPYINGLHTGEFQMAWKVKPSALRDDRNIPSINGTDSELYKAEQEVLSSKNGYIKNKSVPDGYVWNDRLDPQ